MNQYESLIVPDKIQYVNSMVDATLEDLVKIEDEVEKAYGDRANVIRTVKQLDAEVKLVEATAFMKISADNTVEIDGKKVKLANAEMRDAFRRYSSKDQRAQLSEKESELAAIDSSIALMKDKWDITKSSANLVEARAWAQGNLLRFLSSKG